MKFIKPMTLREVASLIHSDFSGNPDFLVAGINEIHKVEKGDLTFVDHPKYYAKALNSAATTIIINKKVDCPEGKALIFSDDPFSAYVSIVKKIRPFEMCTTPVSQKAIIGEGTIIQPGAFIGNNVIIGKNCIIHANVSIYDHSIIGNNVIIHSNTVIGGDAYYFKKRPDGHFDKLESCGRVIIEDNVEIGCLCTIDKGVSGDTIIGKGTKTDNHIQIGHDSVIGKNCLIGNGSMIAGVSVVEDDVLIWAGVAIQKDLVVGKGATILALSGVGKNVPPYKTFFGTPADDYFKKWRELAALRQLPNLLRKSW
ncbi:MAG: LpxD N-terminal domain-containing protein [Bacteroidales bacterium]|nr:LpxD N-terminal domain-containing protein [Bacteroidales bacterium]